jgi:hypothetical protein
LKVQVARALGADVNEGRFDALSAFGKLAAE